MRSAGYCEGDNGLGISIGFERGERDGLMRCSAFRI